MHPPSVYLASVLLEKNRWSKDPKPSLLVSGWIPAALAAGFAGIELWEFHWTRATADEQDRLRRQQAVGIYNCYASLRADERERRSAAARAAQELGAKAIKFNFGADPRAREEEIKTANVWAASLPPGMQLWCECHGETLAETPAATRQFAAELDPVRVRFITHAFADQPGGLAAWLDVLGPRLAHIHVQSRNSSGRWLNLSEQATRSHATLEQMTLAGFTGSYSIEFTAGVNTPAETPASLFAAASEDLRFLKANRSVLSAT